MQKNDKLFEDMAKVFNNALGTMAGVKTDIEAMIRHQFNFLLKDLDLVTREEFEAVKEMAAKARSEQESLQKRITSLEKKLNASSEKKPSTNSTRNA